MEISTITPCFNSRRWIESCVASVRDQASEVYLHGLGNSDEALKRSAELVENVETLRSLNDLNGFDGFNATVPVAVHHHIQDGGSTDGTVEFLKEFALEVNRGMLNVGEEAPLNNNQSSTYQLTFASEADKGMYNALNKAFEKVAPNNQSPIANNSRDSVIGHLNADEQYLPGTLRFVADFFEKHPKVDVLFGAVVVTDAEGNYICSRMPLKPQLLHTQVCHLATFTASMFFRRSAIEKLDCYFDESFKTAGDADLICRMLKAKLRMATVRRYFSIFVDSGDNLALSGQARAERERMAAGAPLWAQKAVFVIEKLHRLRKLFSGSYNLTWFQYPYICGVNSTAKIITVCKPTGRWETRLGNS